MEYLPGWELSPYRKKQAFVWVDVLGSGELRTTFYVWSPSHSRFLPFDASSFPRVIHTKPRPRLGQFEGVTATCFAR